MRTRFILAAALLAAGTFAAMTACSFAKADDQSEAKAAEHARKELPPHPDIYDDLIAKQAKRHGVPESLIHRIIVRESRYRPTALNRIYFGLMQITYATARSMGYKGPPKGLLDAETNLTYGVPYLANAYMVGGKSEDRAVSLYAAGYYFEARRQHKLDLLRTASSEPVIPEVVVAEAPPPPPNPISLLFNALAGTPNPAPVGNPNPNPQQAEPAVVTASAADTAPPAKPKAEQTAEVSSAETPAAHSDKTETASKKKGDDKRSIAKNTAQIAKTTIAQTTVAKTTIAKTKITKTIVPKKTILASAKPISAAAILPSTLTPSKPEPK
jgi:hypothetical protein